MGPVDMEKTCPWIEPKVTCLPELPWATWWADNKRNEKLARLEQWPALLDHSIVVGSPSLPGQRSARSRQDNQGMHESCWLR